MRDRERLHVYLTFQLMNFKDNCIFNAVILSLLQSMKI